PPPTSTLFPYTTLFRSHGQQRKVDMTDDTIEIVKIARSKPYSNGSAGHHNGDLQGTEEQLEKSKLLVQSLLSVLGEDPNRDGLRDRKSTRLNSSHVKIS